MRWFVDTDTCIRYLRGSHRGVTAAWNARAAVEIAIPLPVYGELLVGAEKSVNRTRAFHQVESLLRAHRLVDMTQEVARSYGTIRSRLEQAGLIIGGNDLWIAASALAHGAIVVTSDTREFGRVDGLDVEDWCLSA